MAAHLPRLPVTKEWLKHRGLGAPSPAQLQGSPTIPVTRRPPARPPIQETLAQHRLCAGPLTGLRAGTNLRRQGVSQVG